MLEVLIIAPPPDCSGDNATSEVCVVLEACGDIQARLTNLALRRWELENELINLEQGTAKHTRITERLAAIEVRHARVFARYNRCAARAVR